MNIQPEKHTWTTFSVSTAATRLGVAPATLRTWVRRHGVGPSVHVPGKHRRYSELDLARLMIMRAAILRGASASEGAKAALSRSESDLSLEQAEHELRLGVRQLESSVVAASPVGLHLLSITEDGAQPDGVGSSKANGLSVDAPSQEFKPRSGVIHELPPVRGMRHKERATRLVGAALRGDQATCAQLLAVQEGENLIEWWTMFLRPSLERIATHTVLALPGRTPSVLVGHGAQQALGDFAEKAQSGKSGHPSQLRNIALVFTPEHDEFALPAQVLTAALIEQECNAHVILGPGNSERAAELIKIVKPSVVVFASDLIQPSLEVLDYLSTEFVDLPIYVGLRDGVDLGEFRRLTQVNVLNSYTALFHEVHNAVRAVAPETQYWDHGGETFTLRSV